MPRKATRVRNGIGKLGQLFGFGPTVTAVTSNAQTASVAPAPTVEPADYTVQQDTPMPLTTANMSREQLQARRIARIERATNIVEGLHVKVMLKTLDFIALLGPFYIMYMTTSELGQLFMNGKGFSWGDQTSVNMYGAALFGEAILLGLTFVSQYIRTYAQSLDHGTHEREEMNRLASGAMAVWVLFAAIGALGQGVYLYNYWHPQNNLFYWLLIIGRVCIYTGGDYVAAKYLCYRIPTLKKTMLEERERGKMYQEMEQEEAARMKREKEADAHIRSIELEMEGKERRNEVMGRVETKYGEATTKAVDSVVSILDGIFQKALKQIDQAGGRDDY